MRRWLTLIGLGLIVGCGGARAEPSLAAPSGSITPGEPDGQALIQDDAAKARSRGAGPAEVLKVEAATPGDRVSGTWVVPKDACALLLARVTDGIDDVDLFVYGDDGRVLGSDEGPDRRPTLLVCPPHPERLFVSARVASGHGLVAIAGQLFAPELEAKLRASLTPEAPQSTLWTRFEAAFEDHRSALGSGWQDVRRAAVPVDVSTPTVTALELAADSCLDVLVVPSEEASHLDVALLDPEGQTLGRATSRGSARSLQVCSPHAAELSLEIRPHVGRGLVALLISRAAHSEPADPDVVRYAAGQPLELEAAIAARRAQSRRLGTAPGEHLTSLTLKLKHSVSHELKLAPGCTRLDLVVGAPTRGVRAWLWSEAGALIAEAGGDPVAQLFACTRGGRFRLDVEPQVRPGPAAVLTAHDAKVPPAMLTEPLAAGRLMGELAAHGLLRGGRQLAGLMRVDLSETELTRHELYVPPERCVEFVAAASAAVLELDLTANDARDERAVQRGPRVVSLRRCNIAGRGPLALSVELRSASGRGAALLGWQVLSPSP
ncbi:MAG: hypothetical protein KIT72_13640 [Polyangiaceae bacterium]|nr:hypothetical protein [Polyangiaceae bacterium]MCW5791454.1 hypothetical protein [Polyangiaceae bacterium]